MNIVFRRRHGRLFAALLLFVVGIGIIVASLYHEPPDKQAKRVSQEQQVTIVIGDPGSLRVPNRADLKVFADAMHAEPATPESLSAALDGIEHALKEYPPGFVAKLVPTFFVCGTLTAGGTRASGTFRSEWIIVAAPADREPGQVRWASAATLHHELSSAVLRADGNYQRWTRFWPASQREVYEYDELASATNIPDPDPSTGFLSAYATSNPENDFNEYVEQVFMRPEVVAKLADRHPTVRDKLATVVEAYTSVDHRMLNVFEGLGVQTKLPGF